MSYASLSSTLNRGYLRGMVGLAVAAALGLAACSRSDQLTQNQEDATITNQIQNQLATAGVAGTINVTTHDGEVTLNGSVTDEAVKDHATNLAKSVQGVAKVNNNLQTTRAGDAPLPEAEEAPGAINRPPAVNPPAPAVPPANVPPGNMNP